MVFAPSLPTPTPQLLLFKMRGFIPMPADPSALFPSSSFFPYAVGLFGLGTCYFVWGGQTVCNFPRVNGAWLMYLTLAFADGVKLWM
jgi:hypothetical protein